jgi:propane monooxygenase coupling protein
VTATTPLVFGAGQATSSNRAGMTLMNDQVGEVIAQVMKDKPGVTVTYLPSMIRIDGEGRTDFVYDEFAEALGEEEGSFTSADLEESMSTHYGRMVHEDDRTIMFANPEEAAEYLGFDLVPVPSAEVPGARHAAD